MTQTKQGWASAMLFESLITNWWNAFYALVTGVALGLVVGVLMPAKRQLLRSRLMGFVFWAFYVIFGVGVFVVAHVTMELGAIKPLFVLDLVPATRSDNPIVAWSAYLLAPIASMFVFDFFYYWFHRLQRAPRVDRIHHEHCDQHQG